jgi:hypothetical protein
VRKFGHDILIGPGISNFDFSLFKNDYIKRISETFNVQFRAEFFNILNRANFHVPVVPGHIDIFDSTGAPTEGCWPISFDFDYGKGIQFTLKLVW